MQSRLRTLPVVLMLGPLVLASLWLTPRTAIAFLSFVPFVAFLGWQIGLRRAKEE